MIFNSEMDDSDFSNLECSTSPACPSSEDDEMSTSCIVDTDEEENCLVADNANAAEDNVTLSSNM